MYYPFMHPIRTLLICPGIPLALALFAYIFANLANKNALREKKIPIALAITIATAFGCLIALVVGSCVSAGYWAQ